MSIVMLLFHSCVSDEDVHFDYIMVGLRRRHNTSLCKYVATTIQQRILIVVLYRFSSPHGSNAFYWSHPNREGSQREVMCIEE